MTLTLQQVEYWDPNGLNIIADDWTKVAEKIEELFDRYVKGVEQVGSGYWEGKTAEAAQDRAYADRKTAHKIIDELEALATQARSGYHDVHAPLMQARGILAEAREAGFEVSHNLTVTDASKERTEGARDDQRVQLQLALWSAAGEAETADLLLKQAFAAKRDGLRAMFISSATLGTDRGRSDAQALVDNPGDLNPEMVQRLAEAGSLSPEQLASLSEGAAATVPASQMEYMNQVSRSLDGKSPAEISQIMDKLPPEARAGLANSLQLVSNPKVTASVKGDSEVPTKGGIDLLPTQIRESLQRDDLVERELVDEMYDSIWDTKLNGVADNQAIARIAGEADSAYMAGSDLNTGLMDVGRQYLDAEVMSEQEDKLNLVRVDGERTNAAAVTEEIFAAVGQDKIAVLDAVSDPEHGQDFISDVLTKNWSDDGASASALFSFDPSDAYVENPDDSQDVARATRTGEIMSAVGEAMSTDAAWEKMSSIPGSDSLSVGEMNPEMLQTVSKSMTPYMADLAGLNSPDRPGFDTFRVGEDGTSRDWANPEGNGSWTGSRSIFSVLNTDEDAGAIFNGAAMGEIINQEGTYAADPGRPNSTEHLSAAGSLAALIDTGTERALQSEYDNEFDRSQAVYDRKSMSYDVFTAVWIDATPAGSTTAELINGGSTGSSLKDLLVGIPPDPAKEAVVPAPDFAAHHHSILAQSPGLPADMIEEYSHVFDESENLRPYSEVREESRENQTSIDSTYREMVNRLGHPGDPSAQALRDGYDTVRDAK